MSINNIEAVDLGLSVKWASQNIKSSSDISKDAFFSWGNINEQLYYNRNNYLYLNKNIDNNGVLPLDKDVAVQRLGDKWRMPTITEWNELINQCTWSETTKNGVKGYNVTGNGNTIFLPLSGLINDDGKAFENEQGEYWTSECVVNNTNNYTDAYGATLTPNSRPHYFISGSNERYIGHTVRPVYDETLTPSTPNKPSSNNTNDGKKAKAIDLGLSVRWADCNLGATNETDCGYYFSWGDTEPGLNFSLNKYKWYDASTGKFNIPLATNISKSSYDAATVLLKGAWRMPTEDEMNELVKNCTLLEKDNGLLVSGPNGNTIFLPYTGFYSGNELVSDNKCLYWSSSYNDLPLHEEDHWAYYLGSYTSSGEKALTVISTYIYNGLCIRPVMDVSPSTDNSDNSNNSNNSYGDYDSKSRKKMMDENYVIFKSNHYKKYVIDFTKPWELFKTKSADEFMQHIGDSSFFDEYANFNTTHFDGDFSINLWKGKTWFDWSDYLKSFYLRFEDGAGFSVKSDATNGYFIMAVDFGAKFTNEDLRVDQDGGGVYTPMLRGGTFSRRKTLLLPWAESHKETDFYFADPSVFGCNGIAKVTLYGINLDEVPSPGSSVDYGRYDQIEAKGYKEAIFNFMRPKTLSLFTNTPDDEILYSSLERKTLRNGVASIYFDQNPQYDGTNNHITAQLLVSHKDWGGLFALSGDGDVPGASLSITGRFTISVEQGYEIKSIVFEGHTYGFTLYYDGKTIPNNTEDFIGNTSLPICPIDHNNEIWVANKKGLTSVSFVHASSMSTIDILAVYVGYVKVGEKVTPPTPSLPGDSEDKTDTNIKGDVVHIPDTPSTPDTSDIPDDDNDNISKDALVFTDTGDTGYSVDPNVILYAGGQEVIPQTMTQKDNTLFLGNYKESSRVFSQEMADFIKANSKVKFTLDMVPKIPKGETGSLYMYENQLNKNSYDITSFKGGEAYRFGVVFQNRRGEWSDVVYVGDYVNDKYPDDKGTYFYAPRARISLTPKATEKLYGMGYRKAKPVVVYPSVNNRLAVCQGVLCPTVYNINQRNNNSPYAMSSWFYREMHSKLWQNTGTQNKHNYNIYNDINDYVKASNRVILTIGGHFGNGRN